MISRDELLKLIVDQFKQSFGFQIDFDNPNLETWLAQTLSILDENLLMYMSLLMNESFLTTAVLPSTIKKFALDYGYVFKRVQPAHGNIDVYIGYDNTSNIDAIIDFDSQLSTPDGITYIPQLKVYITYNKDTNVANIIGYDLTGNKYVLPYSYEIINTETGNSLNAIHFQIPVVQATRNIYTFVVSTTDTSNYKFPTFSIPKPSEGSISDVKVYVSGTPAERVNFLFELKPDVYSFVLYESANEYQIIFGNSLIGKAPRPGDVITVETYTSLGDKGNVYANTLSFTNPIINKVTNAPLTVLIKHPDITNGQPAESPNEIRLNTIKQLHMNNRLVSRKDFEMLANSNALPFKDILAIFTESDLYVNEVDLFGFLSYNNQLLQSITGYLNTAYDRLPQGTIVYQNDLSKPELSLSKTKDNALEYVIPFDIVINTDTMTVQSYYRPMSQQIPFKVVQESYYSLDHQSYAKLLSTKVIYDTNSKTSKLELQYLLEVSEGYEYETNIDIKVNITQNSKNYTLEYDSSSFDSSQKLFTCYFKLPDELTDDLVIGDIYFNYKYSTESSYELLSYVQLNPFKVKYNISSYVPCKVVGQYTIYGIPVIANDSKFIDQINTLFTSSIKLLKDLKMITNKISLAFGKTYGLITTSYLSKSPLNTIEDNTIPIPLKLYVKAYVSTLESKDTIVNDIKTILNEKIQPGFFTPVIRSQLIQALHDKLDYLKDVYIYIVDKDGNKLEADIDIQYDSTDIPKDKLLTFVPDVISLGDVEVEVNYL
jgi:hypothetical protein